MHINGKLTENTFEWVNILNKIQEQLKILGSKVDPPRVKKDQNFKISTFTSTVRLLEFQIFGGKLQQFPILVSTTPRVSRENKSLLVLQLLDWTRADLKFNRKFSPLTHYNFGFSTCAILILQFPNLRVSGPNIENSRSRTVQNFRWQIWEILRKIRIKNRIEIFAHLAWNIPEESENVNFLLEWLENWWTAWLIFLLMNENLGILSTMVIHSGRFSYKRMVKNIFSNIFDFSGRNIVLKGPER
jgi:hypothetical protein